MANSASVATPSTTAEPKAPAKRWYRVASAVAALGIVLSAAWWPYATSRQFDAVERFVRISSIGGQVALAHPGPHTLWIEGDCMSCHDNNASEYRKAAIVTLTAPDGRSVQLRKLPSEWTFNTARREGRALFAFDAPAAGAYRVGFDLDIDRLHGDWDNVPVQNLAFGEGIGLPVRIVRPMLLLAGGGIAIALILVLVTATRRRRYYNRVYGSR